MPRLFNPSVVFYLGFTFESFKELGAHHKTQSFGTYMSCLSWESMLNLFPQLACFTNFWHHLFCFKFGKTSNKILFHHQLKILKINMANSLVPNSNALTFWFLNHSWPIPDFFSFKCPYIYTLDIFSYLLNTCTREWPKLVIKTTNSENSYHLCYWHQWPFGASWSWFQKFITKSKLIQLIIYKRHQVGWHLKYFQKLTSKKNSQKIVSFCVPNQKNHVWHSWNFFLMHSFFTSKHIFL
jgi:hypothetical protein